MNFSTRGAVIRNLPKRVFDLVFKPFPWQLQDTSQRLGALGSLIALGGLCLLFGYAWRSRGRVLSLTAPILYPLLFLMAAYSLSAGNAGTGFRYRTHLVVLGVAMVVVLREHVLQSPPMAASWRPSRRSLAPEPVGSTPLPASEPGFALCRRCRPHLGDAAGVAAYHVRFRQDASGGGPGDRASVEDERTDAELEMSV